MGVSLAGSSDAEKGALLKHRESSVASHKTDVGCAAMEGSQTRIAGWENWVRIGKGSCLLRRGAEFAVGSCFDSTLDK